MQHPSTQTAFRNVIKTLETVDQHSEAAPLCRELTEFWRKQPGPISGIDTKPLVDVGRQLLSQKKSAAAEDVLRAALAVCEKQAPDDWKTGHARALLGCAQAMQDKYDAARPRLTAGYAGLKKHEAAIPGDMRNACFREILPHLIRYAPADAAARWRTEHTTDYLAKGAASVAIPGSRLVRV